MIFIVVKVISYTVYQLHFITYYIFRYNIYKMSSLYRTAPLCQMKMENKSSELECAIFLFLFVFLITFSAFAVINRGNLIENKIIEKDMFLNICVTHNFRSSNRCVFIQIAIVSLLFSQRFGRYYTRPAVAGG